MIVKIKIALECLYTLQKILMSEAGGEKADVEIKKSLIEKLEKIAKELKKEVE